MRILESLLKFYTRHFPLQKGKYRLVEGLWQKAAGSCGNMRQARLEAGNFEISCDISKAIQRQFYYFGTYFLERNNLACWARVASESKVIFDVGANLGIYSLTAAAANRDARIVAFEPTPQLAAHLRHTVEQNALSNIEVFEKAVARETGQAVLNLWGSEEEGNEGLNFVTSSPVAVNTQTIGTISLDDFCRQQSIEQLDLLKIDIQGNEAEALKGAERLLSEGRIRCIFTELNWAEKPGDSCPATETLEILERHGFHFAPPSLDTEFRPRGDWLRKLSDAVAKYPSQPNRPTPLR